MAEGLTTLELELMREVTDEKLMKMGYETKVDHRKFDVLFSGLPQETQDLLTATYLMGYNDALSRVTYGSNTVYENQSLFAKRLRQTLEK